MANAEEPALALDRARAGDPRGFDVLFRTFGTAVVGMLRAKGVRDPDDLANEVFVRAFRNIHDFRGGTDGFRAWLFAIAHNAAIDDARRRRRRVDESPLDDAVHPAGGDVEVEALDRLAHARAHALLHGLSPDQRDVLILRIVADLSVEETAAILGKGYEAVRALQRRGLASLRRAISDEEAVRQ
jgi:RNA polymerase sigma-70 factor, ECF subfamily